MSIARIYIVYEIYIIVRNRLTGKQWTIATVLSSCYVIYSLFLRNQPSQNKTKKIVLLVDLIYCLFIIVVGQDQNFQDLPKFNLEPYDNNFVDMSNFVTDLLGTPIPTHLLLEQSNKKNTQIVRCILKDV